jgi:N,N'-diacetyllegionaminate synthase
MKIQIIAEIGWNHMGDMSLAKEMICAASEAGADFAKFQTWSVTNLKQGPWDTDGRREIYEKAQLSPEQHVELINYCKNKNISFLTSLFNPKDVEWICKLGLETIKIPSHEVHNGKLISCVDGLFKQIFISTGASKWKEITAIPKIIKKSKFVLFHCVSAYPAPANNINLPRIIELRKLSNTTGYSGHFFGIDDAIASLNYGVSFIEKHFTIDRNLPGRDNKFALLPDEMVMLTNYCKNFESMNNNLGLEMQTIELETFEKYRGRWSSNK